MNEQRVKNFIQSLSSERFDRYLEYSDGDVDVAIDLYGINAHLSQAMYIPLQALEVTLRNAVHLCLTESYGEFWFDNTEVVHASFQQEQLETVKKRLVNDNKDLTSGRVIAGLSFGFWVSLFGSDYDGLWQKNLKDITLFDKRKFVGRKTYSGSLYPIKRLRNRIAHHECIIDPRLKDHYQKVHHLTALMSTEAKYWMDKYATFEPLYKRHEETLNDLFAGRKT